MYNAQGLIFFPFNNSLETYQIKCRLNGEPAILEMRIRGKEIVKMPDFLCHKSRESNKKTLQKIVNRCKKFQEYANVYLRGEKSLVKIESIRRGYEVSDCECKVYSY